MKKVIEDDVNIIVGTSDEEKPTDVKEGMNLLEVDTGKAYVFYNGTWYEL